ncbi:RNA-directed DNA polymerase from mobile element jockey [Papilio machaon]|uniref:RNA-directed DNA polymerase from mobile element jockey n=1 Tax=Papilio machaon TaxID=76193 RepID=A0A194R017_PAPMA|nr:RNA-directed DNA polymerase from mobile element jockey [Papilio machaon]
MPGSRFRVPGFSCLRDDRNDGYAGSAILVRHSLPFSQIPLPPHSQQINAVAVRALDISFVSVYIPHPTPSLLPELQSILSSVPSPIIALGDLNTHHTMWGCYGCDGFAPLLIDILDDVGLCILNDGSPTRRVFPNQNPKTAVDLSLCSPNLASQITWKTLPSSYGSDHFPIILSLNNRSFLPSSHDPLLKYQLKKAKWTEYARSVDFLIDSLPDPVSDGNILACYDLFLKSLISSADSHIPKKHPPKNHLLSSPWWDDECNDLFAQRTSAEKTYSNCMSQENFIKYQRLDSKVKKLVTRKKRSSWTRFCESLSPRSPSSIVWTNIRKFRRSLNHTDPSSNNPLDWLNDFADKLAPPYVPNIDSFPNFTPTPSSDDMDAPFSFSELQIALNGLKDSTPGEDGVPYSFLTNLNDKAKIHFLNIINKFFETGTVPHSWKSQIVIPVIKPGKNPLDSNSYRPIALSTTLAKITEHLLKNRLEWIIESKNILPSSQFGFRKGLSTTDSLGILTTDIRIAFTKGEYLAGVFLDIASAYDNVQLPVLRQKLQSLSIPPKLTHFICSLLFCRSIVVKHQSSSLPPRLVWKGLPQGSVLSPLLYSIYTHDLELSVSSFCNILQYADDIALYHSSGSVEEISCRINSALYYLGQWLSDHGLSLSVGKCQAVVFTRKRSLPSFQFSIEDQLIHLSDKIKFLGIYLDNRLSGIAHSEHIIKKCEKGINVIRAVAGVWWGAHPYSLKLLYNALVRSHMDYCMFILEPFNKSAVQKLNNIQFRCLRIILGAMKSSPTNALQVECVDPPLTIRRQYLCDRFVSKMLQLSSHPLWPRLTQLSSAPQSRNSSSYLVDSFLKYTNLPHPVSTFPLNPLFSTPYNALVYNPLIITDIGLVKGAPDTNNKFQNYIHQNWSNHILIYTDASKLSPDGCVGAACWVPRYKIILKFKCPPESSVFTGEATALLEAILFAHSHNLKQTVILTDSLSCLMSIKENPFRSKSRFPIILKIREALLSCNQKGLTIILVWIPSHSGIPGNETVDSCAKLAVISGSLDHFQNSAQDLCGLAKTYLNRSWNTLWNESKSIKGKYYASIQPDIPTRPWFFKYRNADRWVTSTISRLRLGHSCTPVFLAKLRIRNSSICECGLDEGTVSHILFNCPKLLHPLYDVLPPNIPRPVNVEYLLTFVFSSYCRFLCKYIECNKIKL